MVVCDQRVGWLKATRANGKACSVDSGRYLWMRFQLPIQGLQSMHVCCFQKHSMYHTRCIQSRVWGAACSKLRRGEGEETSAAES